MAFRQGKYTLILENKPSIEAYAAVCSKKENSGPLRGSFDEVYEDTKLGEKTWEKAESKMQTNAAKIAIKKANVKPKDIDYIFAGDLLNQCICSTFGLCNLEIPYLGLFGACSTMAQALAMAALFVEGNCANRTMAVTSSHFCCAERQFRFPLEYGGQRTPTSQWTVTGSGAIIIGKNEKTLPYINAVTIGKICDLGVKDTTNMGAAMAPAACDTLLNYFKDTNTSPSNYDLILTGDLGTIGSELLKKLMLKNDVDVTNNHKDCGVMIYSQKSQDTHAGGSGCGCSAIVLASKILNNMKRQKLKNILFIATGALMSPTSSQQGRSIPSIAHLVNIKIKNLHS